MSLCYTDLPYFKFIRHNDLQGFLQRKILTPILLPRKYKNYFGCVHESFVHVSISHLATLCDQTDSSSVSVVLLFFLQHRHFLVSLNRAVHFKEPLLLMHSPLSSTTLVCSLQQSTGRPMISTSTNGSMIWNNHDIKLPA